VERHITQDVIIPHFKMSTAFVTPKKRGVGRTVTSFAAGGAKSGAVKPITQSRFAALCAESDSDEERVAPPAPRKAARPAPAPAPAVDALFELMSRPDICWGDITESLEETMRNVESTRKANESMAAARAACGSALHPLPEPEVVEVSAPAAPKPVITQEEALWAQPFAANLEVYWGDVYNTTRLTDAEYETFLTWLYANGWDVDERTATRDGVDASPSDLPARIWIPPSRFEALSCCGHTHSHSHSHSHSHGEKPKRKSGAPVPRFCRVGADCAEENCRYVHEDTIPRVNRPCAFGASCGASDPTGQKRSQCLYMHPGETWTETLVIRRPSPAASAAV
jgi:hypothetical protein